MAENCVAVGPIPNTWEQDVYVQLKQKKKNDKDEIDGVDEAFARGLPESDFMFKPYRATTGIADPYKEMTPWELKNHRCEQTKRAINRRQLDRQ